jgi:hypothetical protein
MWPLFLLCALASTSWLVVERFPQVHFSIAGDALACALSSGACFLLRNRQQPPPTSLRSAGALGGALVLVGPAIPSLFGAQARPAALAIALALTSVVVAVALPALTDYEFSLATLWPGIAAASALLIALPMPGLSDWRSDLSLIATPLATGIGAILYRRNARLGANMMPPALAISAAIFALVAAMQWQSQRRPPQISIAAIALDGGLFLLALFALNHLTALQYTARYALVPLLLLAEGALLATRALINVRTASCALLLLLATAGLLRFRDEENVS